MNQLINKRILLAVTGGIAAYKSAELVRLLVKAGAVVQVVITESAKAFITPMTLQALSGQMVRDSLLDTEAEKAMGHIELAKWAELIVIAPASANCIAKLAHGLADDLLSTLCLATTAALYVAPAMNQQMWHHPATQRNIHILTQRGARLIGPAAGEQACGDVGFGRMSEPLLILEHLADGQADAALIGKSVVVTAGPTREALDPVRYLTNHSSGKMGYAIASAAAAMGAKVLLVSGPTHLDCPHGVERIDVTTAIEMQQAVMDAIPTCDIFIATAAVADYRCDTVLDHKMKKSGGNGLSLHLVQNPDIVATVTALEQSPFVVGFAAETNDVIEYAQEKMSRKGLDMIVANRVGDTMGGFESDTNAVHVLSQKNERVDLPMADKQSIARDIIDLIVKEQ